MAMADNKGRPHPGGNHGSQEAAGARRVRNVTPDKLDLRDRPYLPAVALFAAARVPRRAPKLPVLDQGDTSACTGFALAAVVDHLLRTAGRAKEAGRLAVDALLDGAALRRVSRRRGRGLEPARRAQGLVQARRLRAARCGTRIEMPAPTNAPGEDWWLDAVNRPLGAYYRVDPRSVTDMHVALNEVGILYASAVCHDGWLEGSEAKPRKGWTIPYRKAQGERRRPRLRDRGLRPRTASWCSNSWGDGLGRRRLRHAHLRGLARATRWTAGSRSWAW